MNDFVPFTPPTLEQAKEWARIHSGIYNGNTEAVESWWNAMDNDGWEDAAGHPIKNWRKHMRIWFENMACRKAQQDPARFAAPKPVWQQREEKAEKEAAERARRSSELAKRILGRA